jgi:putative heme-binding domain-containing protein
LPGYDESYVRDLALEVKSEGNAKAGDEVYHAAALSCVACHRVGDAGGILGPDLTAVGAGLPVELIIEAILWPDRQLKEGYIATAVTTKEGGVLTGYLEFEDKEKLAIRDVVTGKTETVQVGAIARRTKAGTIMPPGLTAGLSREELRDLVRYLSEMKGKEIGGKKEAR